MPYMSHASRSYQLIPGHTDTAVSITGSSSWRRTLIRTRRFFSSE